MITDFSYDNAPLETLVAEQYMRLSFRVPYWLYMQGHHGKGSNRWHKPAKPFRRSAAVRKVYRGDVWWLNAQ